MRLGERPPSPRLILSPSLSRRFGTDLRADDRRERRVLQRGDERRAAERTRAFGVIAVEVLAMVEEERRAEFVDEDARARGGADGGVATRRGPSARAC